MYIRGHKFNHIELSSCPTLKQLPGIHVEWYLKILLKSLKTSLKLELDTAWHWRGMKFMHQKNWYCKLSDVISYPQQKVLYWRHKMIDQWFPLPYKSGAAWQQYLAYTARNQFHNPSQILNNLSRVNIYSYNTYRNIKSFEKIEVYVHMSNEWEHLPFFPLPVIKIYWFQPLSYLWLHLHVTEWRKE